MILNAKQRKKDIYNEEKSIDPGGWIVSGLHLVHDDRHAGHQLTIFPVDDHLILVDA